MVSLFVTGDFYSIRTRGKLQAMKGKPMKRIPDREPLVINLRHEQRERIEDMATRHEQSLSTVGRRLIDFALKRGDRALAPAKPAQREAR